MMSANQERYLWEIYTNVNKEGFIRVSQLAKSLQVSVSSVSKRAKKLNEEELVEFQRYGMITLTEKGREVGKRLSANHDVLVRFFQLIDVEKDRIEEEVNNIEFYLNNDVIEKIALFLLNRD